MQEAYEEPHTTCNIFLVNEWGRAFSRTIPFNFSIIAKGSDGEQILSKTCRLPFLNSKISHKRFLWIIHPKEALKLLCYRAISIGTKNMPAKNQPHNGKVVQISMLLGNNYKTVFLVIGLCRRGKYRLMVPEDHFHNNVQTANALWKTVIVPVPSWLCAYSYLVCLSNLKAKYIAEGNSLSQLLQMYYLIHICILRLSTELYYPKCLSGLETCNRHSWRL